MSDVFFAFFKGRGEGCDYTIGCNQRLGRLAATTMEAAIGEACGGEWSEYDDERIEKIVILHVVEEADCGARIDALRAQRQTSEKAAAVAQKRAEFERLRKELEGQ